MKGEDCSSICDGGGSGGGGAPQESGEVGEGVRNPGTGQTQTLSLIRGASEVAPP